MKKFESLKTTITITGMTKSYGDVLSPRMRELTGHIRTTPDPPSFAIEIKAEDGKNEVTYYVDLRVDDEAYEAMRDAWSEAIEDFTNTYHRDKPDPVPNYYGHKITRVVSYDKSVPKAIVEVEGQDGQWCVLFSALDLCTQRWILNEVWGDDLLDRQAVL